MRTSTKEKILRLLSKHDYSVAELVKKLDLSNQVIHRHLKDLQKNDEIGKKGQMPKVVYFKKNIKESRILESKNLFEKKLLPVFLENWNNAKNNKWKLLIKQLKTEQAKKIDFDFLLSTSALYSSNIEGNTLDLNSFLNSKTLSKQKKKEATEIDDLKKAYLYAGKYQLTEKAFKKSHEILSKELVSKNRRGKYRQEPVGVFGSSGLAYLAIEAEFVNSEMSLFFEQITKLLEQKMTKEEIFFWASWTHLMLVLIHPFSDGNGRVARILEKWFLTQKLGQQYWKLQTEKYYWDNLQKYYKNLNLGPNYWETDFKKARKFLLV